MICKTCKKDFPITEKEIKLFEKFGYPLIELCYACDQKRRLCFRNERNLHRRKCDGTDANIISMYSSDKPYKVYRADYWYSDQWDSLSFGRDFDFNLGFFEQFKVLHLEVPRIALFNIHAENSDYCNMTMWNKNCYLLFGGDFNEDCMYGTLCMHNLKCLDLDYSNNNQYCYNLGDSIDCYGSQFVFDSSNCNDCFFISDCIGCDNCILCTNLAKKSYCIRNEQYSKEDYLEKKKELINGSYLQQKANLAEFRKLLQKRIVKYAHLINCYNSDGDYLKNCKECHNAFDASNSEDINDVFFASKAKDCFHCSLLGDNSEVCYNLQSCLNVMNCYFCYTITDSSNLMYCDTCIGCQDCFGCSGLKHKKYCILNKQYKQSEYEEIVGEIKEHMEKNGEWADFFPKEMSCFSYQETSAFDHYLMGKESALSQGFKWEDLEKKDIEARSCKAADNIAEISENICDEVLGCEDCGASYKISQNEFVFYKKFSIPIPGKCSNCRHKERALLRNPKELWERECEKCGFKIVSSYNPNRAEKVYCEKCYLNKIY